MFDFYLRNPCLCNPFDQKNVFVNGEWTEQYVSANITNTQFVNHVKTGNGWVKKRFARVFSKPSNVIQCF